MSPLDTQLPSTTPTELPALDHHQLQRRGRQRRIATRVAAGSAGTAMVAAVVVMATATSSPAPLDLVAPANPTASTASAPTDSPQTGSPIERLRDALEENTPPDLDVSQLRHLRVVSSLTPAGQEVEEWASIAVLDQRADNGQVTMNYTSTGLREGTTTPALHDVLADIASKPDPLTRDAQDRWLPPGRSEPTIGGFEGDQQLDDAAAQARGGGAIKAAQRLSDAILSLSAGAEGDHWREILNVLDQLDPEQTIGDVDLLGRDVTGFVFTTGVERLQLNFDPTTGRPAGMDMLVDTHETDDDGTPLLQREVVVIP